MPSQGNLICNVYNCQNLIPADSDGTSDPYVEVNYYGRKAKTQVIDDSINPIYNTRLVIDNVPIYKLEG
jgi:Ca2+-dependent lipid-binding protein